MSDITTGTWQQIREELETLSVPNLQELLNSADVQFDGAYTITAEPKTYAKLCQYYPLLDTLVQDVTGKRLKLSLRSSVPMGTLNQESETVYSIDSGASNVAEAIISRNRLLPYQLSICALFLCWFGTCSHCHSLKASILPRFKRAWGRSTLP